MSEYLKCPCCNEIIPESHVESIDSDEECPLCLARAHYLSWTKLDGCYGMCERDAFIEKLKESIKRFSVKLKEVSRQRTQLMRNQK